MTTRCISHLSL